jgi:hypothetical protein
MCVNILGEIDGREADSSILMTTWPEHESHTKGAIVAQTPWRN